METTHRTEQRSCAKHGPYDTRLVIVAGKELALTRCPTCSQEQDVAEAARVARENETRRKAQAAEMETRSNIPPRYKFVTLDGYEAKPGSQAQVHQRCQWFATTWPERLTAGTSLILAGLPGTGKTHLACAIAHEVMRHGHSVIYSTIADMTRSIRRTYDQDVKRSEAEAISDFVRPQLLILDEVGAASGSEHEKLMLFEVINKRYEQVKGTIVVSNLTGDDLKSFLGERMMDRLRQGGGKLLVLDWQSYRR